MGVAVFLEDVDGVPEEGTLGGAVDIGAEGVFDVGEGCDAGADGHDGWEV